jgi:hypothetical protein
MNRLQSYYYISPPKKMAIRINLPLLIFEPTAATDIIDAIGISVFSFKGIVPHDDSMFL